MKAWIIPLLFSLLFFILPAAAECTSPSSGQLFTENTLFCHGIYNLTLPLIITRDITIDCQNSTLFGGYAGKGIINSRPAIIKNCHLKGFEHAIVAEAQLTLENIQLEENSVAILTIGKEVIQTNVEFINNVRNKEVVISPKKELSEGTKTPEEIKLTEEPTQPEDAGTLAEMLDLLDISSQSYAKGQNLAEISRNIIQREAYLEITLVITAKQDAEELRVIEWVPKGWAKTAADIASEQKFAVLKDDPVIEFSLGSLKKGEERIITYTIDGNTFTDLNPREIVLGEPAVNPYQNQNIRKVYYLSIALLLLLVLWPRRKLREAYHKAVEYAGKQLKNKQPPAVEKIIRESGWTETQASRIVGQARSSESKSGMVFCEAISVIYVMLFGVFDLTIRVSVGESLVFWGLVAVCMLTALYSIKILHFVRKLERKLVAY